MRTQSIQRFLDTAASLAQALDTFVDRQRAVTQAVRDKDWPALEAALREANRASEAVGMLEAERAGAWSHLLADLGLPPETTVFRASLALPLDQRSPLTDAYRALRLSALRARIENQALNDFVGSAASALATAIEEIFPGRKGRVYGKSGRPKAGAQGALVLNAAF